MTVAPTIVRTRPKLSDYLFAQDKTKFKLPKSSSRPWVINNASDKNKLQGVIDENLVTDFENILSIHRGADPDTSLESFRENSKYQESLLKKKASKTKSNVKNMSETPPSCKEQKAVSHTHVITGHSEISTNVKSRKTKKCQSLNKSKLSNQHIDQEEETEEDRSKRLLLERDIELEYQQQVNKMFNNQESSFILNQRISVNSEMPVQYDVNPYMYPPLYLQGPHGMYYITVPPPQIYNPAFPGSSGCPSDNECSDDGGSTDGVSEELLHNVCDLDISEKPTIQILNPKQYDGEYDISEDVSREEYSSKNDVELTNLVLSIIDD